MDSRFQSLGPLKADWLIFFFEIHFTFHCFRVRYEGKYIPLEIIILNCTQNVNCAFGYLIVHSGDQKCRMWKRGATPHVRTILPDVNQCQQREGSSEPRNLPKMTDFISVARQALFSSRARPFVLPATFPSLSPCCFGRAGLLLAKAPDGSTSFNKPNPVKWRSHQAALSNCTQKLWLRDI